ncbi:MAG: hypothetical protein WAW23_04500 [Candidatus Methanoperedens sp.]
MGNYMTPELEIIKDFLTKTLEAVDSETAIICKREESGEFHGLDDFSNALYAPMEREAIAIRAVFYEIYSLIEWELHNLAAEPYQLSTQNTSTPRSATSIKFVYDMPIGKVQGLIERYYKISFSDMPSFAEVDHIRHTVNAFKHRKGFKDFRRDKVSKIPEKFQPSRENAYQAIDDASTFLKALWNESKLR